MSAEQLRTKHLFQTLVEPEDSHNEFSLNPFDDIGEFYAA